MLKNNRFLLLRRTVQISLLLILGGGNWFGWTLLQGNYSAARVLDSFYLADPYAVLQMLLAGAALQMDVMIGAGIVFLFYALLAGRSFCSWVCPVNILSDFTLWLRRILGIDYKNIELPTGRTTRYWLMGLGLLLSIISGVAAFEFVSPVSVVYRGIIFGFGFGWLIVLALFVFDFALLKNGWCGHLCPLGGFYSLTSRFRILKVKHTKENCTLCNKCFTVCPEKQVLDIVGKQTGVVAYGACSNCARCIEVCDDNALHFSLSVSYKAGLQPVTKPTEHQKI